VDLFPFIGWVVAVVCLVTLAFPLNVPLMALAYKVRHGSEPLEVELVRGAVNPEDTEPAGVAERGGAVGDVED